MTTLVSQDKWRAGIKFLTGLETNPELSFAEQLRLRQCLRGPFARGMNNEEANATLKNVMDWEKRNCPAGGGNITPAVQG